MEINIDLLKLKKKSAFRIILGLVAFILAFSWIIDRMITYHNFRYFDWFYFTIFIFFGILHTYEGFGYSIRRILGKSYININNEVIAFKNDISNKEQKILWSNTTKIVYKPNNFIFYDSNNESFILNLSNLEYSKVIEIKEYIYSTAKEKKINIQ